MNQTRQRIEWLDMAKGYGMIFVILGHLNLGVFESWIFTFHMPLFFFLSGYVFSEKENFKIFIKSKCKSIVLPYIFLGIPALLFDGTLNYIQGEYNINDCWNNVVKFIIQRRMWTFWFLACLFFLNIFFYIAKKILKTNPQMGIFAIFTVCLGLIYYKVGGVALPWNIDVCLMAYPFYLVGYLYKNNKECVDKYLDDRKTSVCLFMILLLINIICGYFAYKISGSMLDMWASSYSFAPLTFISAFAGIACVIIVSKRDTIKLIQYIGQNSLLYLAWHQVIMTPLSVIILGTVNYSIDETSSMLQYGVFRTVQVIFIIVALTICNYVICNTKLKFMVGKN